MLASSVRPQRDGSEPTIGKVEQIVFDVAESTQNSLSGHLTAEFNPFLAVDQAIFKAPVLDQPVTQNEVKIGRRRCRSLQSQDIAPWAKLLSRAAPLRR